MCLDINGSHEVRKASAREMIFLQVEGTTRMKSEKSIRQGTKERAIIRKEENLNVVNIARVLMLPHTPSPSTKAIGAMSFYYVHPIKSITIGGKIKQLFRNLGILLLCKNQVNIKK